MTLPEPQTDLPIESLMRPDAFPHTVDKLQLLETHISWVILTGSFAYKIKKPVKFDFVDYTTVERRKEFCEREIKLNCRFARQLYLGVVPILSDNGQLRIAEGWGAVVPGGPKIIDYAVKMRQFEQDAIVASRLHRIELTGEAVESLGVDLALFHDSIEIAPSDLPSAQPKQILSNAIDNFQLLAVEMKNSKWLESLTRLEQWTRNEFEKHESLISVRLRRGFVRRCHGDLHLKNIVQLNGRLIPYDGIEFNEAFQWIDIVSEIAFPLMDFVARGRADLGWRLLNSWLEITGDFEGINLLRFYSAYRAMVRAKVTWLNRKTHDRDLLSKDAPWDKYLTAANYFEHKPQPSLTITHGFSGSGKSTAAMRCAERAGGIRIRSDVERTRLTDAIGGEAKFSASMTDRVYRHISLLARKIIEAGLPAIVDATFLERQRREDFFSLANDLKVPFSILDCTAPYEELCRRIEQRQGDASEATIEVLNRQVRSHDPLTDSERQHATATNTSPL